MDRMHLISRFRKMHKNGNNDFFATEQKVEQIFDFCAKKRDAAPQIIKRFFFHPLTSDSLARSKKKIWNRP